MVTLLLKNWNYTSTDELETLNIDLTLLATEYIIIGLGYYYNVL